MPGVGALLEQVHESQAVFGQQDATVQLFKLEPDARYANKVKVTFGRSSVNTIEIKKWLIDKGLRQADIAFAGEDKLDAPAAPGDRTPSAGQMTEEAAQANSGFR